MNSFYVDKVDRLSWSSGFCPVLCNLFTSGIKHKTIRFQQTHPILFRGSHKRGNWDIIIVLLSATAATKTSCWDLDRTVHLESWWDTEDRMEGIRQMIFQKTGWHVMVRNSRKFCLSWVAKGTWRVDHSISKVAPQVNSSKGIELGVSISYGQWIWEEPAVRTEAYTPRVEKKNNFNGSVDLLNRFPRIVTDCT